MGTHDDTAARDGGLDERIQLLIAADGELQVARGNALHLERRRFVSQRLGGAMSDGCTQHSVRVSRAHAAARLQVLGGVASQLQHLGGEVL